MCRVVLTVDMDEAGRAARQLAAQLSSVGCQRVHLPCGVAAGLQAGVSAIFQEASLDALVRPTKDIDTERVLARFEQQRHGDKETALKRADFEDVAGDAKLALSPDGVPANRGGKARGHAANAQVAAGEKAVELGMPA